MDRGICEFSVSLTACHCERKLRSNLPINAMFLATRRLLRRDERPPRKDIWLHVIASASCEAISPLMLCSWPQGDCFVGILRLRSTSTRSAQDALLAMTSIKTCHCERKRRSNLLIHSASFSEGTLRGFVGESALLATTRIIFF